MHNNDKNQQTMMKTNIKLNPIEEDLNGELAEIIYYECKLCAKTTGLYPDQRKLCEKLSGNSFYCNFCIQNNLTTKNNKNILILSFRAIIGYYHQFMYLGNKKIYHSQIEDFIKSHQEVGLLNPVFRYDPESYLWFVDFSKVGRGNKKIPVSEVLKTVVNILSCFSLPLIIDGLKPSLIYEKYEEAIKKFYSLRYRPENKRLLIPTLTNCGGVCDTKNVNQEMLKNFTKKDFLVKSY